MTGGPTLNAGMNDATPTAAAAEAVPADDPAQVTATRASHARFQRVPGELTGIHASVVQSIGRRIVAGELAPGDQLPEQFELSRLMGVSRTVIREATKVLASKGLVDSRPKRGTVVTPRTSWRLLDPEVIAWQSEVGLDPDMLRMVFEVRRMIEPAAATLAAERSSSDELRAVRRAYEAMAEREDEATYLAADIQFHDTLVKATHNDYLIQLVATFGPALHTGLGAGLRAGLQRTKDDPAFWREFLEFSLPLHLAVLETVEHRDPDQAAAAMLRLVEESQRRTLDGMAAADRR